MDTQEASVKEQQRQKQVYLCTLLNRIDLTQADTISKTSLSCMQASISSQPDKKKLEEAVCSCNLNNRIVSHLTSKMLKIYASRQRTRL